jgi:hypothetical protein
MTDFTDLKERLDLLGEIEKDLGPGRKSGKWVMFSCPFPGHKHGDKTPSLAATPANGRYYCFACGRSGDLITWLHDYRLLSWKDIKDLAGSDNLPEPRPRPAAQPEPDPSEPPPPAWQARGLLFMDDCESALWSPAGARALDWLHKRGLADDTIKYYRLGYNQAEMREKCTTWGLPDGPGRVWLPRGVIIPWLIGGKLWAVHIRQPVGDPKYIFVSGSQVGLFGADNLAGREIALLTEGEFDCMLADQWLYDVAGCATLGGASKRLDLATWGVYLLPVRAILAAYDLDPAGRAGLADLLHKSARIHPVRVPSLRAGGKDLTDYHQAGGDLYEWFKYNLDGLGVGELAPAGVSAD